MRSYLVTGGSGQLGQCFQEVANEFPDINLFFATRNEVNISRPETIVNFYSKKPFDGIINCAAYTNVDLAENEQESTFKINVDGIQNLIDFAEHKNLSIIAAQGECVVNAFIMVDGIIINEACWFAVGRRKCDCRFAGRAIQRNAAR